MHNYHYKIQLDDGTEYYQDECPRVSLVSEEELKNLHIDESAIGEGCTITKVDEKGNEVDVEPEELGLTSEDYYEVDYSEEE